MPSHDHDVARRLLADVQAELAPRDEDNRLVAQISEGSARRPVFGRLAAEEWHVVCSDWRCFHLLAARSDHLATRHWFAGVAAGEELALKHLDAFAAAAGLDPDRLGTDQPHTDRQAYPAYLAWLAVNGEPSEVVLAVRANFAAWGRYCSLAAAGMRTRYGFSDDACAFFDFFADPEPDDTAVDAIAVGLGTGRFDVARARHHAQVLQTYELDFWNSYAAPV